VADYSVRRMLRVDGVTYERGDTLSAQALETIPERTRQALERLGWIAAIEDEPKTPEAKPKPGKRGEP
jgi:hypothetical protein